MTLVIFRCTSISSTNYQVFFFFFKIVTHALEKKILGQLRLGESPTSCASLLYRKKEEKKWPSCGDFVRMHAWMLFLGDWCFCNYFFCRCLHHREVGFAETLWEFRQFFPWEIMGENCSGKSLEITGRPRNKLEPLALGEKEKHVWSVLITITIFKFFFSYFKNIFLCVS